MKKMLRNAFILLFAFSILVLSSCAGDETPVNEAGLFSADNVNPAGAFPIVKEPITLRMAIQSHPQVTDFQDNDFTRWVEEMTGIGLEMEVLPSNDIGTRISLMFASGEDLPDIINVGNIPNDVLYKYVLDGLILPVDPYFGRYGENFSRIMMENRGMREAMMAPDGHIYGIPKYNVNQHNMYKHGKIYLYEPWLEKLGLDVPETTEELYDVLRAFKTGDPNGNGKADEIPMAGAVNGAGTDPVQGIMSAFIPYNHQTYGLYNNGGRIEVQYTKPEFLEGLTYLRRLVTEKLVDPISFTQTQQQLSRLANRDEVVLGGFMSAYSPVSMTDTERFGSYVCLDLLDSGTGKGGFLRDPLLPKGPSFVITKDCRAPEAAFRLADFLLSREASMRNRHGVEGRDWEYIDDPSSFPGTRGLLGDDPLFRELRDVWSETGSVLWRSENLFYNDYDIVYRRGIDTESFSTDRYHAMNSIEHYIPYTVGDIVPLSSLFFTKDELSEYSLISVSIHENLRKQLAAFVTGARELDEYDAFLNEMRSLGLEKYLEYIQTAYDRQFGEK